MGQIVKVYDADGKYVDSFRKVTRLETHTKYMWNDQIKILNATGHWIKGQTTSKGVKIK